MNARLVDDVASPGFISTFISAKLLERSDNTGADEDKLGHMNQPCPR